MIPFYKNKTYIFVIFFYYFYFRYIFYHQLEKQRFIQSLTECFPHWKGACQKMENENGAETMRESGVTETRWGS
jgi:hypothetical protein